MTQLKALLFFSIILLVAAAACGPRRSAQEKRYPLKGKVVAVNKAEHTQTTANEPIPASIPGIPMPLKIKNDADLQMLNPGDEFTAPLVTDDLPPWIKIPAIVEGGAPLTPTA